MNDIDRLANSRTADENLMKLAEENAELTQAVSKYYERTTTANRQHIIEEMVDVLISMDVVRHDLCITDAEMTDMRYHKMKRNLQRLEHGQD